jgi:hypothetical protein
VNGALKIVEFSRQTKSSLRADPEMASTAGFFNLRSTEMA